MLRKIWFILFTIFCTQSWAQPEAEIKANRISIFAQPIGNPANLGAEYERRIFHTGIFATYIAGNLRVIYSEKNESETVDLKSVENAIVIDMPLRLSLRPEEYFEIYAGPLLSWYSSEITLSGNTRVWPATQNLGNFTWGAELGFRYHFDAYSFGMHLSGLKSEKAAFIYKDTSMVGAPDSTLSVTSATAFWLSLTFGIAF